MKNLKFIKAKFLGFARPPSTSVHQSGWHGPAMNDIKERDTQWERGAVVAKGAITHRWRLVIHPDGTCFIPDVKHNRDRLKKRIKEKFFEIASEKKYILLSGKDPVEDGNHEQYKPHSYQEVMDRVPESNEVADAQMKDLREQIAEMNKELKELKKIKASRANNQKKLDELNPKNAIKTPAGKPDME